MPNQRQSTLTGEEELDFQALQQALDVQALNDQFESLTSDASHRISNYRYYLKYFDGEFGSDFRGRAEGRARNTTNWNSRSVYMLANFILPSLFEVHMPRETEQRSTGDVEGEVPEYSEQFNRTEIVEKKLRRILRDFKNQGLREFKRGLKSGLVLGDAVFFAPFVKGKKTFQIQSIFPGYVRIKFADDDFERIEYAFVNQIVSTAQLRLKYNRNLQPDSVRSLGPNQIWDWAQLESGKYSVVKKKIEPGKITVFTREAILEEIPIEGDQVPIFLMPTMDDPFQPWGHSYLRDIIPIVREHNNAISDEDDIVKLFSNPKVIIRNATQKDIDNIKKMWKKGVVASKGNLEVQPFEFKNNVFPIEQRISSIIERYHKISGLGPAVFGLPPGSINTGPSLTVQYAPTLQMAQIVWDNWEPSLLAMFEYFLKTLEALGGKDEDSQKDWSEIIDGNYLVNIKTPFRIPREESIHVANEVNKFINGLQSKTRTMENLGIESPEDELILSAYEKFHPLLNPELQSELESQAIERQQKLQQQLTPEQGGAQGAQQSSQAATNRATAGTSATATGPSTRRPGASVANEGA